VYFGGHLVSWIKTLEFKGGHEATSNGRRTFMVTLATHNNC
jgi:hypothetical protein